MPEPLHPAIVVDDLDAAVARIDRRLDAELSVHRPGGEGLLPQFLLVDRIEGEDLVAHLHNDQMSERLEGWSRLGGGVLLVVLEQVREVGSVEYLAVDL